MKEIAGKSWTEMRKKYTEVQVLAKSQIKHVSEETGLL